MNGQDSKAEIFDVFLCHNSEDKPAVREIAQKLAEKSIKPWLDEEQIPPGTSWQTALEQQIERIKSAVVFVGDRGVGPWQNREIRAFLNQFVDRECRVIPAILPSAKATPKLPLLLRDIHYVDFRVAAPLDPLRQLIWGITGVKPSQQSDISSTDDSTPPLEADVKGLFLAKDKTEMELTIGEKNIDKFSRDEQAKFLTTISNALDLGFEIRLKRITAGSIRLRLELNPEDADKIYAATQNGQLAALGVSEARLYPAIAVPPDEEQRRQLLILLNRVNETWVEGVLRHSLYNDALISLGKRPVDKAVEPPWKHVLRMPRQRSQLQLEDQDITTIFEMVGLVLILGEPGSGKTTTLLDLARTLLERARDDIKERVPIVLNLSSWKKKQPLAKWMAEELSEKYQVPRRIALFWLEHDYLLPLLDGLDEVEITLQPDCVAAINTFIEESNPSGLVVCCRLSEYRWLPERLKLNGAICLEPLSKYQVDEYLGSDSKLGVLYDAVNTDPVLQELTQTPLMLSIMSLAYQGAVSNGLARQKGDSREERRKQIFGLYVEQMFQRKETTLYAFPKEKAIGWLSWLARKMRVNSESVFLVEGLQPSWLDTTAQWVVYGAAVALSLGLSGALIGGLSGGLAGRLIYGLRGGLIAGLFAGLSIGVVAALPAVWSTLRSAGWSGWRLVLLLILTARLFDWLKIGSWVSLLFGLIFVGIIVRPIVGSLNHISLVLAEAGWKWNQFWKRTIPGLIGGMSAWLMLKLITGGSDDRETLTIGLFCSLICGLVSGLVDGFICGVKMGKASPNQGIKLSRKNALVAYLISCFTVGLILGLSAGPIFGLRLGLVGGLIFGLIFGLFAGLNRGGSAVIKHYALRLILWLRGYTPFNFIKFLDHCDKLILLKKVGGSYIFIHRMLLDYFADLPTIEKSGKSKRT